MFSLLNIINSIAAFQLIFFTVFLFIRGKKIPSTFFLKIHLIFQVVSYLNLAPISSDSIIARPILLISIPASLIWAPTFYFYVRSRLYPKFIPELKLLIHAIPAFIVMIHILGLIITGEYFQEKILELSKTLYFSYKVQLLVYNFYTLLVLYRYQHQIADQTSASEDRKLNWLFFITYGIAINALIGFIVSYFTQFTNTYWGYLFFLIFINIFFFKAIIQPDQFLGIDEKKITPVKLERDMGISYFRKIEEIINSKQLFLDPDLSLHNVAQAVKLPDRIVSQSIKQNIELNFIDYINKKRIDYAKEILQTTTRSEKNVLEILYLAGFNSKSVFNSQFKKHTGQSPTEFRQSNSIVVKQDRQDIKG